MSEGRAVRARVEGRVQGVSYRASAVERAQALGVSGWVRNLPDGTVEMLAQGDAAAVDALLQWAHQGPPGARVETLRSDELTPDPSIDGFQART